MPQHSTLIHAASDGYQAARRRAALIDRTDRGRIVVSGADRGTYLQGLLTNDIQALRAGQGCYSAYLTPQGRMIADMYVYELGEVILLTTIHDVKDAVLFKLDQFVFAEDVQLGDVTASFAQFAIVGPQAAQVVASVMGSISESALTAMPEHGNARVDWRGSAAIVTRTTDAGEAGYDVYVESTQADGLRAAVAEAGVRERESRLGEDEVVVLHQVEVEGARRPPLVSLPSRLVFDPATRLEQGARGELGRERHHLIEVVGLIAAAQRRGVLDA